MVKKNNYMGCRISEIEDCGNQIRLIQDEYIHRLTKKFNDYLRDYLIENLKSLGHEFDNESDFINFCKENITQRSIGDIIYLYLPDLTLIGKYSKSVSFDHNVDNITSSFTISIG